MVNIGKYNRLKVVKLVDFGAYLDGGNGVEILLPAKYIGAPLNVGEEIEVFIYTDSEDRLIATTERPLATVGEFAYLEVVAVNKVGAFLDWGLLKNLLVPFSEQKVRMRPGMVYLVYVYLDDVSKRVAASAKIDKFIGNKFPVCHAGDQVKALVYQHTEIGYKCIVDNLYHGMLYDNELYDSMVLGDTVTAYVKQVRDDGKIDLTLKDRTVERIPELADKMLEIITDCGKLELTDKSDPEIIKRQLHCSKKDFKKAVGLLLKTQKIQLLDDGIVLFARN